MVIGYAKKNMKLVTLSKFFSINKNGSSNFLTSIVRVLNVNVVAAHLG